MAAVLAVTVLLTGIPMFTWAAQEPLEDYGRPGVDYIEGEAIVCVRGGEAALTENSRKRSAGYETETLLEVGRNGISTFSNEADEPENEKTLMLVKGQNTRELIRELEQNPAVEYAEPNYIMVPYGGQTEPLYDYQWGLENSISESLNQPSADINIEEAWAQGGMNIREFSDYEEISGWALEAMSWAVNTGLLNGKGNGILDPKGAATRGEAAQILMNFHKNIAK